MGATMDQGKLSTDLGGTRVSVDKIASPLLYASPSQINMIVPYGAGTPFQPMKMTVTSQVGLTDVFIGGGGGIALFNVIVNQDISVAHVNCGPISGPLCETANFKINSVSYPAPQGSIVTMYATGEGATTPSGVDGAITQGTTTVPVAGPITVKIDGINAEVLFAGEAPGIVAGVLQINARVPTKANYGPVSLYVSGKSLSTSPKSILWIGSGPTWCFSDKTYGLPVCPPK